MECISGELILCHSFGRPERAAAVRRCVVFVHVLGKQEHMCCIEQRFVCFQNLGLKTFHADLLAFSSVTGKGSSCRCVNPWHRGGSLLWTAWLQSVTLQDCWGLWVCSQRPLISVGSGSTQTFLNFLLSLERKAWQAVQKHSVVLFGSTLGNPAGRCMKDKTRWYPTIKFIHGIHNLLNRVTIQRLVLG